MQSMLVDLPFQRQMDPKATIWDLNNSRKRKVRLDEISTNNGKFFSINRVDLACSR
jgi:hypothetical protein